MRAGADARGQGVGVVVPAGRGGTASAEGPPDTRAGHDRWRARLEEMWRHKVDTIVLLSVAYHDTAEEPGDDPAVARAGPGRGERLIRRLTAEHAELADIEEALDRLKAGRYGSCVACGQLMPAAWLAETPQASRCPVCSLERESWQPRAREPRRRGTFTRYAGRQERAGPLGLVQDA